VQFQHRRCITAVGLTPCAKTKDPWTQQLRACAHAHVPCCAGHVPQAHMVPRGPADDPEEPLAALASFDGEEHKVPTK
jgi:hypothetical protein